MQPFSFLPAAARWPVLGVLIVLTVTLAWLLGEQGEALKLAPAAPDGLLSLEFAWTGRQTAAITHAWGSDLGALARHLLLLDPVFALGYGAMLSLGCAMVATLPDAPSAGLGRRISWLVLAAVPACIAEDLLLVRGLDGAASGDVLPLLAGLLASVKFALVIGAFGYLITTEARLVAGRLGIRSRDVS